MLQMLMLLKLLKLQKLSKNINPSIQIIFGKMSQINVNKK